MSLKGRIEDIPLVEVIQLIALAEKTGALAIRASLGEGGLGFSCGRVVSAYCWNSLPVDPRAASLAGDRKASFVRDRIRLALTHLLRLSEGFFEFVISSVPPGRLGMRDVSCESLDRGLAVQDLLFAIQAE